VAFLPVYPGFKVKEGVTGMGAEAIAGGIVAIIFSTCWWLVKS